MMDGYSRNAKFEDVLMIFLDILKQGLSSPGFSFVINNALISMYSKCGSIKDAAQVFLKMERKDVFSWTAMITGCAHHGLAVEALQLFERMKTDGIKPNQVTFLALLMACAHGGLVQEGAIILTPCQFDRAKSLVEFGITLFKPYHDDILNLWKVLLGACHASKQLDLGVEAATKILELEPEDEATYILLANLYASSGLWEDAIKVRKAMRDKGLRKEVGCSWIDTGNRRHVFVAGDVYHPQRKEIYEKLAQLNYSCRRMGYVPMTELVLHDVDETEKEAILGCHSEKLAVSFGLLNCGVGNGVIRVMKNLRVCEDCHSWMKFASLLEKREILLRDSQRFHLFRDGSCSCGDYW
ncbi:Pentatricopeptide repeat-containing protein, chloroplastic [Vitis vinifera]|uniref:Pentatricopeptide repeat-containing protein, chloroplastic n=1 Tax=Vitis vinifera TaxID=29760 RepID=A0A438ITK9_VITVI|nr:Pentatricopeptide repeat-containing protein, chloroplastic [Vitis vinifera]